MFAEPGSPLHGLDDRIVVHGNTAQAGCFGNWRTALSYLAAWTPENWILVVQDDAIWSPGAADLLRAGMAARQDVPTGFLSAYVMEKDVSPGAGNGWSELRAGWLFWGALALCLPPDAAEQLQRHDRFVNHATNQQIDAVVAASMLDLGRPSFVHVPSLVDHIGETSTLGHEDAIAGVHGYRFGE